MVKERTKQMNRANMLKRVARLRAEVQDTLVGAPVVPDLNDGVSFIPGNDPDTVEMLFDNAFAELERLWPL